MTAWISHKNSSKKELFFVQHPVSESWISLRIFLWCIQNAFLSKGSEECMECERWFRPSFLFARLIETLPKTLRIDNGVLVPPSRGSHLWREQSISIGGTTGWRSHNLFCSCHVLTQKVCSRAAEKVQNHVLPVQQEKNVDKNGRDWKSQSENK